MRIIDGSLGEGGGQILRTSLALAAVTGQPFRIERIRAGRKKPGLLRQHLVCVEAAVGVSGGVATGSELGSLTLEFTPGAVKPGRYSFSIGTAGSTSLVLQTVLPPLLRASGPSEISVEGGTHNSMAPTADYLTACFLPLVNRLGPACSSPCRGARLLPGGWRSHSSCHRAGAHGPVRPADPWTDPTHPRRFGCLESSCRDRASGTSDRSDCTRPRSRRLRSSRGEVAGAGERSLDRIRDRRSHRDVHKLRREAGARRGSGAACPS